MDDSVCINEPLTAHDAALMQNQVQSLRAKGVAAEYLASSRSAAERRDVLQRMESGSSAPELVFITPESVTAAP